MQAHRHLESDSNRVRDLAIKESKLLHSTPSMTRASEASPQYYLPKHIYACSLPGGVVFLDLLRNRYFSIGETDARAVTPFVMNHRFSEPLYSGASIVAGSRVAARLITAGLLQQGDSGERTMAAIGVDPSAAPFSLEDGSRGTHSVRGYLLSFALSCMWARAALKFSSLYAIASRIQGAKKQHANAACDNERLAILVHVFRTLRPYAFTPRDQCLFHALALTRFLHQNGQFPTWVIGVRIRPWGAHSWVQHGHWVLDTTPEIVREYVPLLAV